MDAAVHRRHLGAGLAGHVPPLLTEGVSGSLHRGLLCRAVCPARISPMLLTPERPMAKYCCAHVAMPIVVAAAKPLAASPVIASVMTAICAALLSAKMPSVASEVPR